MDLNIELIALVIWSSFQTLHSQGAGGGGGAAPEGGSESSIE